jgi:Ca2+-dependent lipid-binding protein
MILITGLLGFFVSHTLFSGVIQIFVICAFVVLGILRIRRYKDDESN